MAVFNRKIRAIYAGAIGAVGLAVGSALDPLSARSQADPQAAAPVYLKAAGTSPKAPAPTRVVTVKAPAKRIQGKPIEWWQARAVANRRSINRMRAQASSNQSSNQSNNSSSNQSSNSSSNQSSNSSSNQSSNSSSNQSSNSSNNSSSNSSN